MLLEASFSVFVHLDPRRERVLVPDNFTKQPHLILEIGLNMPVPIRDLDVTDEGVSCTLSFNRCPFWCRIPWSSIFAVVSGDQRGMVWPDDVPKELASRFARPAPHPAGPTLAAAPTDKPAGLQGADEPPVSSPAKQTADAVAAMGDAAASDDEVEEEAPKTKRRLPPYLRVIK